MWFDLILQSFQAHLFIPLRPETLYYATVGLAAVPPPATVAAALLGCALASAVNLACGKILGRAQLPGEHPRWARFKRWTDRYLVWLLAVPGMGLLGMLTLLMAASGVRWRRIALALGLEHLLRYAITAYVTHRPEVIVALLRHWLMP